MSAPVSVARRLAQIVGIVLLLVSILGFVGGDNVLGIFPVNMLHNIVHLATGIAFAYVGFAGTHEGSVLTFKVFGFVYLVVTILHFVAADLMQSLLNAHNTQDMVLHAVFAVAFLAIGYTAKTDRVASHGSR